MVEHIFCDYPPTQEDISKVNQQLSEPWYPPDEIVNLWEQMDHTLNKKAEMQNVPGLVYLPGEYIHHVFMAIHNTGMFTLACVEWEAKPAAERATKAQLHKYFNAKYRIYKAKQKSKAVAGIANNVVLQQNQQHQQDAIVALQQ